MSSRTARREYLQALAQFERACMDYAKAMEQVLEPPEPTGTQPTSLLSPFGPRKPAKRASSASLPRTNASRCIGA
jgi:hypothetical protein